MEHKECSSKTVGIACGLILFAYAGCCYNLLTTGKNRQIEYTKRPDIENISAYNQTSNITNSGQSVRKKVIRSIREIPTYTTYEVSQWITSGDWSQDDYPLTVTIPSKKVVMDIDYVEDHWDDYINDPEDEISYPQELFQ